MAAERKKRNIVLIVLACFAMPLQPVGAQSTVGTETEIVVTSEGWDLVGDLNIPDDSRHVPGVLLLNQAAGNRAAYQELSRQLALRGIASLRLDLRGHGDSVNQGRFIPGENARSELIWDAEVDVIAAFEFLISHDRIDENRVGIVGASYSGEEMSEAGRKHGYANAYVALSPGSFSAESVLGIDESGSDWLFVTSRDERFLQEIRASVQQQSRTVEQVIVPGDGHATDLLGEYPDLAERIAVWLDRHL